MRVHLGLAAGPGQSADSAPSGCGVGSAAERRRAPPTSHRHASTCEPSAPRAAAAVAHAIAHRTSFVSSQQ